MKLLLLFTLLATLLIAKEQKQTNSLIIHKPFDAALFAITQNYDYSIAAAGFSNNYKVHTQTSKSYSDPFSYLADISNAYGPRMTLVSCTAQMQKIRSKVLTLHEFSKAVALKKTPRNGYFVGGYTTDGKLLVLKLTANGDKLFSKKFGTQNYNKLHQLLLLQDGGVLAIASSFTTRNPKEPIFQTGLGDNDIFLTRLSKNGTILWSKKYGGASDDRGIDAAEADDGTLYLLSTRTDQEKKSIKVMRLSQHGDRLWSFTIPTDAKTYPFIKAHRIISLRDGSFVILLSQIDTTAKEQIRILKIDAQRHILLDRTIATKESARLVDLKAFRDGRLAAVGFIDSKKKSHDGVVMIFSAALDLLQQHSYGGESYDNFYALTILHNSKIAVVGEYTPADSQEHNMWLLLLRPDGTKE